MSYKVRIPIFEGPFDLLVYLIEDAQMDICDIRIAEITSQYLDYLAAMKDLNVNVSSEFMVLAAELLRIKSRMMLPRTAPEEGLDAAEDPRSELVRQLTEYRKCRAQSEFLRAQQEKMDRVFSKPQEDLSEYRDHPDECLSLSADAFARAFRAFLHRRQKIEETMHRYTRLERERRTMEGKMREISQIMVQARGKKRRKVPFRELVRDEDDPDDVVVSFLSLLQLTRDHYLDAEQKSVYGEIYVSDGSRDIAESLPEVEAGALDGTNGEEPRRA